MSDWKRSSRLVAIDAVQPEMLGALRTHIERHALDLDLGQCRSCIETVSVRVKRAPLLGPRDKHVTQVAVIAPKWLAIVVRRDKPDSSGALTMELAHAHITDYADEPAYAIVPDAGLFIEGPFTGRIGTNGALSTSFFLGLGDEPASAQFKEALQKAVELARR